MGHWHELLPGGEHSQSKKKSAPAGKPERLEYVD
jgi:hypothetical protein